MLTSLRGGVSNFDCPAPPLIESNKQIVSGVESTTCWNANRATEVQIATAFDQAWDALLEEDDDEAMAVLRGDSGGGVTTMTCRLGYRSAVVLSDDDVKDAMDIPTNDNNDCQEREGNFEGDARVGMLFAGKAAEEEADDDDNDDSTTVVAAAQPAVVLVHNLSKEYVLHSLRSSPLVQQYKLDNESSSGSGSGAGDGNDDAPKKKIQLISLAHNPETQIAAYLLSNHHQQQTNNNGNNSTAFLQQAHDYMKQSLTSAFVGYETAVKEGLIDGYGVDSNGLSLPPSHDMQIHWRDVVECAVDAYLEVHGDNAGNDFVGRSSLKVIRLPGNVLETRGLSVANEICTFFGKSTDGGKSNNSSAAGQHPPSEEGLPSFTEDQTDLHVQQKRKLGKLRNILPKSLEVYVTRPLTAYPYGGTGWGPNSSPGLAESSGGSTLVSTPPLFLKGQQGGDNSSGNSDGKSIDATHPIRILDYQVEAGLAVGQEPALLWSNHHYCQHGPRPAAYQPILNAVLSHFDADSILEASRERELTVDERETLDGCKLLRDMIHDLDASLDTMKSFAAYEEYLMNVAVPLIYGAFEELDEESAGMLQLFFKVHGMAVRMVVARWTRDLLLAGWKRVDDDSTTEDGEEDVTTGKMDKKQEKNIAEVWKSFGFGDFKGGYDVREEVTLQEFALKHLLKGDAVRGVVVGCSRPEHVLEAMRAADSSSDSEEKH